MEIFSLYVDPQHQRKGIGEKLLIACLDIVKKLKARLAKEEEQLSQSDAVSLLDIDNVMLWVGIPNVAARMFYEKNGAKIVPGFHRESAYGWKGGMVCYCWRL